MLSRSLINLTLGRTHFPLRLINGVWILDIIKQHVQPWKATYICIEPTITATIRVMQIL